MTDRPEPPPRPMSDAFVKTRGLLLEETSLMIEKATPVGGWGAEVPKLDEAVLATLGFGGDELRGSLLLVASPAVWRRVGLAGLTEETLVVAQLCDMAGELCNLIVGRFRKRLLRLGIDLGCGVPTSAYGQFTVPRLPAASALYVGAHELATSAGPLFMRTDVLFRDAFVFPTATAMGVEPAETDLFF